MFNLGKKNLSTAPEGIEREGVFCFVICTAGSRRIGQENIGLFIVRLKNDP